MRAACRSARSTAQRLAKFKHPRRIAFLDTLPKSALGKAQKFELKELIERSTTG